MNKTIDFKWLEEKTSPEMVAAVRETIEKIENVDVILNAKVEEVKFDDIKVHFIQIIILTAGVSKCHYFQYDVKHKIISHDSMHRSIIRRFTELETEHIDHLTKEVEAQ